MTQTTYHLLILDYPDCQLAAVYGLLDLFALANRNSAAVSGNAVTVSMQSQTEDQSQKWDALLIPPNLSGARGGDDTARHHLIQNQHQNGTLITSVCAGAFWLGHAGLVDNRPITTHWGLGDELQQSFPHAHVNTDPILIDDHDIVTAGGLMAWLDMGFFLVERWMGADIVSQTARLLLVDPAGREQRSYRRFVPTLTHGDKAILSVQHHLESHYAEDITVPTLAEKANLSPRTFLRRFKKATHHTPQAYLQSLRLEKARGLLERTQLSINEIGWQVGFTDPSAFSRLFKDRTGLTAGEYRKRFRLQSTP